VSDTETAAKPALFEPTLPPEQAGEPVVRPWDVLPRDAVPPAATLVDDRSEWVPEVKPIDLARYTSREFHDLEVKRMWSRTW